MFFTMEDFSNSQLMAAAAVVLLFTLFLLDFWAKNRNLPPGPRGVPFFGYYPFLTPKPHLDFTKLAKKYGDVFCFRSVGGKLFVILNGPKVIKEVLVNRSEEFIGRPLESNLLDWLSNGMGVAQEEGSSWKEHRRFFLHSVKNFGFGKLEIEETIHREINTLMGDLHKTNGEPTDVAIHICHVVSSVITQIVMATRFEKYGSTFHKLAKSVHSLLDMVADHRFMLIGYPFHLAMRFLPWSTKVHEARTFLTGTVKNIIEEHVSTFDPRNLRDYVDSYLYQMSKLEDSGDLDKSSFTMERLLAISMNMTMEGTGADSVKTLLLEASKHPKEQALAQKELDAVVGRERLPSWLDKSKLPYVDAFIQELFRTAQAFPLTAHYSNFEETTIRGFRIPKRSIIVGNLWTINYDENLYPNPSVFDPQRFLENEKVIKTSGPYPFSMGKRDCVGQSLARMEVFLIISAVLQSFTLLPDKKTGFMRIIPRN